MKAEMMVYQQSMKNSKVTDFGKEGHSLELGTSTDTHRSSFSIRREHEECELGNRSRRAEPQSQRDFGASARERPTDQQVARQLLQGKGPVRLGSDRDR